MVRSLALVAIALLAWQARGQVLLQEDFEDENLSARGWTDIARWGADQSLSIAGEPEVQAKTGRKCLKIRYAQGSTGGWMHHSFKGAKEFYCRYYRLFPEGWEWPKGYGPHDTLVFAGKVGSPTDTDLSLYLDFWKTADTLVRVATARQKWGYGGYGQVLRKHGGVANQMAHNVSPADKVELGKWHCVEFYARLSDPGQENGGLTLWVNGKLVGELDDLPLVDEKHAGILFDHWMLGPYFHGGSHREQWNYLDSLVVSTSYIGTLEQQGNQPPGARFVHARDWGCLIATFDASRSADPDGKIVGYRWDFGDGASGDGKAVSHPYARWGDYTVRLTVVDDRDERHTTEQAIRVGPEVGSGDGLKAEYYEGEMLVGRPVVRTARSIDFRRRGWEGRFLSGEVRRQQRRELLLPLDRFPATYTLGGVYADHGRQRRRAGVVRWQARQRLLGCSRGDICAARQIGGRPQVPDPRRVPPRHGAGQTELARPSAVAKSVHAEGAGSAHAVLSAGRVLQTVMVDANTYFGCAASIINQPSSAPEGPPRLSPAAPATQP